MNNSLYSIIKQRYKEKNRSLKIVTDFDECLFPRTVTSYHIYYQELTGKQVPFADFFKDFWSKAEFKYEGYVAYIKTSGFKEIEEEREKNPEAVREKTRDAIGREKEDLYEYSPPLSITADLFRALKEGLIYEIVVQGNCSPWHKKKGAVVGDYRKREILQKTFGNFPQVKMKVNVPVELLNGEKKQISRAEFTKREDSDVDIFIDDNPVTAQGVVDLIPDALVVMPDYKANKGVVGENVCRIPVSISSLKNIEFIYQPKNQNQISQEESQQETSSFELKSSLVQDQELEVKLQQTKREYADGKR